MQAVSAGAGDTKAFGTLGSERTPCISKKSISAGSATSPSSLLSAESQEAGQVFQDPVAGCQSRNWTQQKPGLAAGCEQDKCEGGWWVGRDGTLFTGDGDVPG